MGLQNIKKMGLSILKYFAEKKVNNEYHNIFYPTMDVYNPKKGKNTSIVPFPDPFQFSIAQMEMSDSNVATWQEANHQLRDYVKTFYHQDVAQKKCIYSLRPNSRMGP